MCRSLVFVTFMVAAVLHSILAQGPKCSAILKTSCSTDGDCACSGPRKYICNYRRECNRISIFDIMNRQPCSDVYKQSCITDDECPCNTTKLVCEDGECVKAKRKLKNQ